jgi:hypothetical protein
MIGERFRAEGPGWPKWAEQFVAFAILGTILGRLSGEIRRFGRWFISVLNWLFVAPWLVWLFLIVLAVAAFAVSPLTEPSVRLTGMLLQLVGFVTSMIGLHGTGQQFGLPGLVVRMRQWLGRFPPYRRVVALNASSVAVSSVAGRATATVLPERMPL